MPNIWEDRTGPAIENITRAFKEQVRANLDQIYCELIGFHDGDHSSYMAGALPVTTQDLTLADQQTNHCYFGRYLRNSWDSGKGGMVPQYVPFLTRIVQIGATLFHRTPTTSLVDVSGKVKQQATDKFNEILRRMRFTARAKRLQKRVTLLNTAFAYPRWDGSQVQLDVITPNNVEVYPDPNDPANLDKALMIRHRLPSLEDSPDVFPERWLVWQRIKGAVPALDEWTVHVVDNGWRVMDNPYFPENVNPYKAYPYVVFNAEEQQDRIFQQVDDSLLSAQVGLDILATWYAFNQPDGLRVFKTGDGKLPKDMPTGRGFGVELNVNDEFEWVDMPFDAQGMMTWLEATLKYNASLRGLTPDVFSLDNEAFTTALTGLARQMDRWDVQEVREDQEPYWEFKLDLLRDKIVKVHNYHSVSGDSIDPSLRLAVEWAQPAAPVDPQSQAQTRAIAVERGWASAVDFVMEDHNIATREDGMAQARLRAQETAELNAMRNGAEDEPMEDDPIEDEGVVFNG